MKKRSEKHKRKIAAALKARHNFPPFKEAREEVRALHFKRIADYKKNRPIRLPYNADDFYKSQGWISWFDYLGKKAWAKSCKDIPPFKEAREEARSLHFKTREDYENNHPPHLPYDPKYSYSKRGEWTSWDDFLGTENRPRILPFQEARAVARAAHFNSVTDY